MPIATRTFRVFVSSTFEDLKAERDALQRDVFPKLRTLCEQHGARFQAIDLRWGVRDEAGLDQQTMEICLREIERCQRTGINPNFIVLLGDRYGWQPLPPRIPASEFDALLPHIPAGDARALAKQWYWLDENAVPPEYCLQPRTGEFETPAAWNPVEQTVHQALAHAARAAGLPERALVKYEASATHQEILAGLGETEADRQHVFGFFRRPSGETAEGRPGSNVAPTLRSASGDVGPNGVRPAGVAPTLRSAHAGLMPGAAPEIGTAPAAGETDARLEDLKKYLRARLPGNIEEFDPGGTAKLCNDVYARLKQVIEAEVKRFEDRPALDLEVEAHDRFAEDRCRIFTGRESVLTTIADYLRGEERRPLVLHGEPGSGKSAVMAKASQQYRGPGRVIRRFIGASPESASGHALLTSLCRQIAPGETPVDYAQLENAFKERLKVATAEQPLILFIDAFDQLAASDPARDVTWLPPELPPHVKVIVSTTVIPQSRETTRVEPGFSPARAALKGGATPPGTEGLPTTADGDRLPEGVPVQLERMAQSEGGQALDELLREERRTLQSWQRETVLAHFERCGLPLYLKLAAEESRLWKSYAPEGACTLGDGVAGVIDTLFDRLSSNANHGDKLVERSLGYLAAARYGLAEDEILDVLTEDDAVWNDFNERKHHEVSERRLPVVVWSRLSLDLEPYLAERAAPGGTVLAFYHRQLAERVERRFLAGGELKARHIDLARHFAAKPPWLDEAREAPNTRRAVELVFQHRGAQQWREGEATLFDCQFLFAKVAAGMVLDLDADYQVLLQEAPESELPRRAALRLIHGAVRLSAHVVVQGAAQFASQMVGRLLVHRDKSDVAKFLDDITASAPRPWFRALHPCPDAPGGALLRMLEGHSDDVKGVAVTADGKRAVSASRDGTLKVWDLDTGRELGTLEGQSGSVEGVAVTADGKRAVSASDHALKVWDLENGRALRTLDPSPARCVAVTPDGKRAVSTFGELKVWDLETGRALRTLAGHPSFVNGVAVMPDGKRAISASWDGTLKTWDLETGSTLCTRHGRSNFLSVAVTPDGKRAVSASWPKTLAVWDLESDIAPGTVEAHLKLVWRVAVTPDGKRAVSASEDNTLKVWDLETGRVLRTLEGHSHFVYGVAVTPDGKRAVSASADKTLKVWDLETGRALRTLEGHYDRVTGVATMPDGRQAISASWDKTLKVWDLETGRALRTLKGHSDGVNGVAVTADGKRAVSACDDATLRVWDLETGRALRTLEGHSHCVSCVAVTPDGKQAVSASWDKTLKMWDLETGWELGTLEGHSDQLRGVAVTPDGKRAISASLDKTLKMWDLETGQVIATFYCDGRAWCCAFAADGRIVAGDQGGRVYFLALEE